MLALEEMTAEQRAVLRACEERFEDVTQTEDPFTPEPPPVFAEVQLKNETKVLQIKADGTTRAFCPGYMGVPIRLYGTGKRSEVGPPKYAKKYLEDEKARFE